MVFNQEEYTPHETVRQIQNEAEAIHRVFHTDLFTGQLKLNTDGCSKASGEGAELWGIYRGLTIIFEKSLRDVLIESDAATVVFNINNPTTINYPHRALLEDIKFLMHRCNCIVSHIPREGNQFANGLANMGVHHGENLIVLEDPPNDLVSLLVADIVGLSCERA
ncbi:uncharacterized protein LOC114312574 [Camellia sinensis]|uniref:uncharacterized protein LOC114312574 n=1 Tax=Camellia sinensis TaxID=4442 RepID=UPI0010361FA9|nr:uncharacterized protein LOC114312574 [Camellia sinensis]